MKIGVLSNFYPPMERGGAELVAQRIADELSARGHHVFVLSTMPFSGMKSLHPTVMEYHVQRVYRFYPFNFYHLSHASYYPFPLRMLWHVLDTIGPIPHSLIDRVLQQEEPDVILTHNLKGLGVRASRCVQEAGILQIHTLHDVQLSLPSGVLIHDQEGGWMNSGMARNAYERLAKQSLGSPNIVISPSRFLADFYQHRGFFPQSNIRVIPNPAPKHPDKPSAPFLHAGPVRFFFVGQLESHKGIELLLKSIDALDVPFELHIAGDGSFAQKVSERAQKDRRIFFHGFISLEHIHKIMARSDAILLPSLCYENSPTVIYEAFQSGVPVIASRIGGIPELLKDGENGLLFEPGSVEAFVLALKRFVHEREAFAARRPEIRRASEAYALTKYVDQLEGMFGSRS